MYTSKQIIRLAVKNFLVGVIVILLDGSCLISQSFAIPSLQLDIKGGTYDKKTETIVSSGSMFTLYAYLIPDSGAPLTDEYYISAAISPQVETPSTLGSFSFAGSSYDATKDLILGNPPVDTAFAGQGHDPGDLPPHDIFPTYFMEYAFKFDAGSKATAYDTQEHPGIGPTASSDGKMYYKSFEVDTGSLDSPYVVHFDLYNTEILSVTQNQTNRVCTTNNHGKLVCRNVVNSVVAGYDIDIKSFAPFSHDAESSRPVPEPSTLLLLGSGFLCLGAWAIRHKRV